MAQIEIPETNAPNALLQAANEMRMQAALDSAAQLLPSQGPITVFVHHNTLHAFESLPFDEAVRAGGELYGCNAWLAESEYREELRRGRIGTDDLEAVLQEDLGDRADHLIAHFGTRYGLRLTMLRFPLHSGTVHELRWAVAESDALRRFRGDLEPGMARFLIGSTRRWLTRRSVGPPREPASEDAASLDELLRQMGSERLSPDSDRGWDAFVLRFLWRVCCDGVRRAQAESGEPPRASTRSCRHRDVLLEATGQDADLPVHEMLTRFCAAFLDQGLADWELPYRDRGFYQAFIELHAVAAAAPTRWLSAVAGECRRLRAARVGAIDCLEESLQVLGVPDAEQEAFITQTLLALRGWAGMIRQMETKADWAPHPAPTGSLMEFLTIRLLLDRLALQQTAEDAAGFSGPVSEIREHFQRDADSESSVERPAFAVFQLAQLRGWAPQDLHGLSTMQWATLISEIADFDGWQRRRLFHRAFERNHQIRTLDALLAHSRQVTGLKAQPPLFQMVCCIDEREESFRRHLEEVQPACETLGMAGFFGVAMYYRGIGEAHFRPLCPVNVTPRHYVVESPLYSAAAAERRRAEARRHLGRATHQAHRGTRSVLGGLVTGLLGTAVAIPLVARILFPRAAARVRQLFGRIVRTQSTELHLERLGAESGPHHAGFGYSLAEMTDVVTGGLQTLGLTDPQRMTRLIVICGHGSSSLNNPHEAAYDCGACGGGRGGPNARAFAQMANDPRVRARSREHGIEIPDRTWFVGAFHNTCDDRVTWYDLDRLPVSHRPLFEAARTDIDEARRRSSHERCRRFDSAELNFDVSEALHHVEGRAEDLSQTRPEYGHTGNALCLVGRRNWSRGLFLDRRAFLTSCEPPQDAAGEAALEALLQAVIPVCAGINLEYYFSRVDPTGYGCGTKLPHNITALLGVMDGAASDLRPGLPWQMVEIHEPVRLLFVVESAPAVLQRIIDRNPGIRRLVCGEWVRLAVFDPEAGRMDCFVGGEFRRYVPQHSRIPTVACSLDWYRGRRDYLGFASVMPLCGGAVSGDGEGRGQ